jgi:uncharacterized protein YceH (UPF0502 family)
MENEEVESAESDLLLSALEARVLGCLMEKEATTPDVYPLSLNSLVNACNQKNNRNPVMAVDDEQALAAIELLRDKHLLTLFSGANSRAIKYKHRFSEIWPVEPAAQAFMCELMLRGPQTAAGLRGNCERLAAVPDLPGTEELLADLAARPEGAMVQKLPRQAGQKEALWAAMIVEGAADLVSTDPPSAESGQTAKAAPIAVETKLSAAAEGRITNLEAEVAALRTELAQLRESLGG